MALAAAVALSGCAASPVVVSGCPAVPALAIDSPPKPPISNTPMVYQPTHWDWTGSSYVATPGIWVPPPIGGTHWMEGYWAQTPAGGCAWQPAHWM